DEKRRVYLAYQGRWGFIEDWLLKKAHRFPVFQQLVDDIKANPTYYKTFFDISEEEPSFADSPEMKKIKGEMDENKRQAKLLEKELSNTSEKRAFIQHELEAISEKVQGIKILLEGMRRRAGREEVKPSVEISLLP
ncbi:hypothetical protein BDK51DRAFT_28174, partial [Blyttiomyces helicus]